VWGGEPNGLAIDLDGNLVTANISLRLVQRMTRDGRVSTVLEKVDGQRMTSANFVFYDRRGRLRITCLTREDHWRPAVANPRPDGFIVLVMSAAPASSPTASTPPARRGWTRPSGTSTSLRR
jgi:gluconolactonase